MSSVQELDFLNEISNFIFTSKYARYDEKKKRRETWEEAVARVEQMHLKKYSFLDEKDKAEIKWAFDLVREKRCVPSLRSMQFGGKAVEAHHARMYNCGTTHISSLRSFSESFYLLLCGTGVGFGITDKYLNRLEDLVDSNDKTGTIITYVIEDTIEGWSDSIHALLMCYFKNTPYTGRKICFDYSRIRKKGAPLKTGGGKAPGYKGLKNAHIKIKSLLDHIIEAKFQKRLKTIDAYDILMHCADAVLSGGVRRSATSVVFSIDDEDMANAKTDILVDRVFSFDFDGEKKAGGFVTKYFSGKVQLEGIKYEVTISEYELDKLKKDKLIGWFHLFPHRARSNNSVLLMRDGTSKEQFQKIVERTKQFGEPGFVWSDDENQLFNPCFEIGMIPITKSGRFGNQFCNLTTINGRLANTKAKFLECVKATAIIGTLQAGYCDFKYLSNATKEITEEEALLGCSITGMMDNPDILLNAAIQQEGANLAVNVNEEWARKIRINPAARITAIKPEGTSSLLLGTGSGIHPHHARKYFRRVQCNKLDNVYKHFKKHNPSLCDHSVWSANNTDDVVTFPIKVNEKSLVKSDLTAIKHLEIIKSTQLNWVLPGTTKYNKKNISHNVSCTVIVGDDEWPEVIDYLYTNRAFFSAVSFIPKTGDKLYAQAPMEAVSTENDEVIWNNIISNFKHVNYQELKEEDDETSLRQEIACAGGKCEIF